jgi:hypothetical protein
LLRSHDLSQIRGGFVATEAFDNWQEKLIYHWPRKAAARVEEEGSFVRA